MDDPNIEIQLKQLELDSLLDITNAINRHKDEKSLFKIFLFTLVANFKVEKLILGNFVNGLWISKISHGVNFKCEDSDYLTLIDSLVNTSQYSYNQIFNNEVFDLCLPIIIDQNLKSILLIKSKELIEEKIIFLKTISNILIVAIENIRLREQKIEQERLKKELQIASSIQEMLFPRELPLTKEISVYASYLAHDSVGGDYYDFIPLGDDEYLVCMADVTGKGIAAAILMSNIQSALRVLVKQTSDLTDIVKDLNQIIRYNTRGDRFVTMFIAKISILRSEIKYINCGHNPPLFLQKNQITQLDKGTTILGILDHLPFIQEVVIKNIKNSTLLMYTDGLIECYDLENYDVGIEVMSNILKNHKPDQVINQLNLSVIKENMFDDITIMCCKM